MKTLKSVVTLSAMAISMSMAIASNAATTTTTSVPATTTTTTTTPSATTMTKKTTKKSGGLFKKVKKSMGSSAGFTCKDGSHSKAKTTRGACSGHGGIAR